MRLSFAFLFQTAVLVVPFARPQAQSQAGPSVTRLVLDQKVERELAGDASHRYRFRAAAGHFLQVVVNQRGIDVVVELLGPDSARLAEMDSPNGSNGPERVSVITTLPGDHVLIVRSLEKAAPAGRYEVTLEHLRPASSTDRRKVTADRLLAEGESLRGQGTGASYELAAGRYGEALALLRENGDRSGEGAALRVLGWLHANLGRPDSAEACYRAAIPIHRELKDRPNEASTIQLLALVQTRRGRHDSALVNYNAALAIWRELANSAGEAQTLSNIGTVFSRLGNADSALFYLRLALPLQRAARNRTGEGITLTTVGGVFHQLRRSDSAIAYYREALAIQRAVRDRRSEAVTLGNLGSNFDALGQFDSAGAYYREALGIQRQLGDRHGEAMSLSNMGFNFHKVGRLDSALWYGQMALRMRREVGDREGEAASLNNLGVLFGELGQPDSALSAYEAALVLIRDVGDVLAETNTLTNMADLYWMSQSKYDVARAVAYFDSAAAVAVNTRRKSGDDANRIAFAEIDQRIYGNWATVWLLRSKTEGSERSIAAALAAVERGRAQTLLDLMRQGPQNSGTVPPPYALGADLVAEASAMLSPLRRHRTGMLSYRIIGDSLLTFVLLPSGELRVKHTRLQADTAKLLIAELRAGLGADAARASMARGASGEATDQESSRGSVGAAGDPPAFARVARALSTLLLPAEIASAFPRGTEILIVPHGVLGLVPFAALPVASSQEPLGVRLAVRFAPSLTAANQAESRPGRVIAARSDHLRHALVVGNPAMPEVTNDRGNRARLAPLAGAEAEARRAAALLGAEALVGGGATETAVRRRLPAAPLIHLATHGLAFGTEARVRNSYVALSADATHDGLLTVGELLDDPALALSADLVVLSACQTGLGDLREAEGTVGLQRALLARGARSVLVTLWSVDDRATALFMERFYDRLFRGGTGTTKAEALRKAQADVRRTPQFAHPRFWAGFQLVGAR